MAKTVLTFDMDVEKTTVGAYQITAAVDGLNTVLFRLEKRIAAITAGASLGQYLVDALKATGKLDNEFLVLRLSLGKLRVAIGDAFAPLAQVILPVVQEAVFAAIRFVKSLGRIIRALLGVKDSSFDAADAQVELGNAAVSTSKAIQRSLAGFDRLNRLNAQSGSVSVGSNVNLGSNNYELDLKEYLIFNTIANMLEPLKQIDLTPLTDALKKLKEALKPITKQLFEGLRWAWDTIFVPIIQWSAEILLPKVMETLAVALTALNSVIEACKPALMYLWENFLKPLGQWAAEKLLAHLDNLQEKLRGVNQWMQENEVSVEQLLLYAGQFLMKILPVNEALEILNWLGISNADVLGLLASAIWNTNPGIQQATTLFGQLGETLQNFGSKWQQTMGSMGDTWDIIKSIWGGVGDWFGRVVFNPLKIAFRDTGNGIIGILNRIGSGLSTSFNGLFSSLNKINITFPDWVPLLGGKKIDFGLGTVTMPQIPYLAQGAVLPANKPFLAMVGDQHHGTNIEAPLQTIQEAVRVELQDLIDSNLAGQEAVAGILRQILEAVLGISISDGDIATAAHRYQQKAAVIHGGLY